MLMNNVMIAIIIIIISNADIAITSLHMGDSANRLARFLFALEPFGLQSANFMIAFGRDFPTRA